MKLYKLETKYGDAVICAASKETAWELLLVKDEEERHITFNKTIDDLVEVTLDKEEIITYFTA